MSQQNLPAFNQQPATMNQQPATINQKPETRNHKPVTLNVDNFYQANHKEYFNTTVDIDPSDFLEPLARLLEPGASILDLGCGAGRDLLWFSRHGFRPTGFENAPALAELARKHSGCKVIEGDFTAYNFSDMQFDALVFVGSLVHVPRKSLSIVLASICKALVPGGYILITMKEGQGTSRAEDGRVFTLWQKDELSQQFLETNLKVVHFSRKISKLRSLDIWLEYVLKHEDGH